VAGWLKRFGLHLAAAVGATGIFVLAAAVGANQTRQQEAAIGPPESSTAAPSPAARRKPSVTVDATATPRANQSRTPRAEIVRPERSLAGTIEEVLPDALQIRGVGGREWRVAPAPALIRLNGRAARLDALRAGDTLVVLGQAQPREGSVNPFLAHAITARRK
jgi:hypothetical protein